MNKTLAFLLGNGDYTVWIQIKLYKIHVLMFVLLLIFISGNFYFLFVLGYGDLC